MSENYLGEIRSFAFGVVPSGWLKCDGTLVNIRTYTALFSLLGIYYGGDGRNTFGLPDLQGRTIVSTQNDPAKTEYRNGDKGGLEAVPLSAGMVTMHNHSMQVEASQGAALISTNRLAIPDYKAETTEVLQIYATDNASKVMLNPSTITQTGGAAGHPNLQPYLAINYCIAYKGIYPTRP